MNFPISFFVIFTGIERKILFYYELRREHQNVIFLLSTCSENHPANIEIKISV